MWYAAVAMEVWMHEYVNCTSFKFISVASRKFIPKQKITSGQVFMLDNCNHYISLGMK